MGAIAGIRYDRVEWKYWRLAFVLARPGASLATLTSGHRGRQVNEGWQKGKSDPAALRLLNLNTAKGFKRARNG